MPLPVIAGAAAAVAARLAAKKAAQKVATKIVKGKIVKGSDVAKAVKKVNAKTAKAAKATRTLAEPSKASVKVLPRKTAPKSGLENRGARLSPKEKAQRASDLSFGKMEKRFDSTTEMRSTGLVSSRKGLVAARGAGKKNQRKADAIKKEATKVNIYEPIKKAPIKINSQRNLKKK